MTAAAAVMSMVSTPGRAAAAVLFLVMAARDVGLEAEGARQEISHSLISAAADAAEQLNARLAERRPGTAADPAADQDFHAVLFQKTSQCAMTAACSRHRLRFFYGSVFHFVNLKLFRVAEMLKNLSILIGYCNSHRAYFLPFSGWDGCSCRRLCAAGCSHVLFFLYQYLPFFMTAAPVPAGTAIEVSVTEHIIAAFNGKLTALHQALRKLFACRGIDGLHSGSGNLHLLGAFLLAQPLQINEADSFKLIQRHNDLDGSCFPVQIAEAPAAGERTDSSSLAGSGHGDLLSDGCLMKQSFWHMPVI